MSHSDTYRRTPKDLSNLQKCGVPSASVHPLETTVIPSDLSVSADQSYDDKLGVNFRHSGWAAARQKTYESLIRTGATEKRLQRFRDCGSQPFVYRSTDDHDVYRLGGNYCHDKLCRPCASTRSRLVTGNLARNLEGRDLRFLTLTILDEGDNLAGVLGHLTASFRRLRAEPLWKAHVYGGCAFTEVKYNFNPDHWHVHLHMLIEGTYFAQATIRELWRKASRGSFIVDIRPVTDAWGGAHEVAKYCGKPMDHGLTWRPDLIDQAAVALQRRRLFTCFGKWRGFKLSQIPEKGHWEPYESLHSMMEKARNHDIRALHILVTLGIAQGPEWFGAGREARPPPGPVSSVVRETQALLTNTPAHGGTPIPWAKSLPQYD